MGCAPTLGLGELPTARLEVGSESLVVAVADTSAERQQGLRDVDALPAGIDGMLFVFEDARSTTFGMADTLIPLDIWWFNGEGELLGSTEMEPCAREPCASYGSPGEIGWALETPLGALELASGDHLTVLGQP